MRVHTIAGILIAVAPVFGQTYQRQANIVGGGSFDQGKCTIEVVVDATAEVQLRGTTGVLRNLAGQAPQWRRFDCTGPMPVYPTSFTFSGVSGRGSQTLFHHPGEDGNAVIRINDPNGGSSTYVFDVDWTGNPGQVGSADTSSIFGPGPSNGQTKGNRNRVLTSAEAVETCQREISRLASQRFGGNNIYFRRTAVDNGRGNQDRVRGTIDVNSAQNQSQRYRFDCSVNLNNGRVRTANIETAPVRANTRDYGYSGGNYDGFGVTNSNRAIQACETAVDRRLAEQGFQRGMFGSIDIDERTGNDRVFGTANVTDRNQRQRTVDFSCAVNFSTGAVSSVDAIPRR